MNGFAITVENGELLTGWKRSIALSKNILLWYPSLLLLTFALYAALVWHVARTKEPWVPRAVFGSAALVTVGLFFTKPYLSTDLLSYLAHGRLFAEGRNPHVVPLVAFESDPYALELRRLGWHGIHGPSPYGAPISWLERAAGSFEATTGILVFKVFVLAALAIVVLGVHRLAQRHFPGRELAATTLVVWNPSLLIETVGEGHNDIFVTAALVPLLYFAFEKRPFASAACLVVAIALKYFPAFAGLPFLVFLYRMGSWRAVLRGIAGGAAALVVCVLIALPLWPGLFGGVEANTHTSIYVSLSAFLVKQMPREVVERLTLAALGMTIAGAAFYVRSLTGFVRALFLVTVVWIFVASRQLWAWYSVPLVALAATFEARDEASENDVLGLAIAASLPTALVAHLEIIWVNGGWPGSWRDTMWPLRELLGSVPSIALSFWFVRKLTRARELASSVTPDTAS